MFLGDAGLENQSGDTIRPGSGQNRSVAVTLMTEAKSKEAV